MNKLLIFLYCLFNVWPSFGQYHRIVEDDPAVYGEEIHITAIPDKFNKKIMLQWSCTVPTRDQFFSIERSEDGKHFDIIGVIKSRASYAGFTDEHPSMAKNHYRIKTEGPEGEKIYSKIASVGLSSLSSCKVYPNPVQNLLIVRADSPVELRISDVAGNVRIQKQLPSGIQVIDVSRMEKGLYIISIIQKDANSIITQKLVKE